MKKLFLIFVFLCPVTLLKSEDKMPDINEGHLYHEERESLKEASTRLQDILGEDAEKVHANCFETKKQELIAEHLSE